MDLITLAMAMQNGGGGGGGAGAPLIVPGELTAIDGMAAVEIETELADIYAAAEAGRAVFLEWNYDGDTTRLLLVSREYDGDAYTLTFGAALIANDIPAIVSVSFNNETEGFLDVEQMTDAKYDIEIRHNGSDDTWEADEFDFAALTIKPTPISVRAIEEDGYLRNYFVYQVIVEADAVEVALLDMGPATSASDQVITLVVYPDGTVVKQ